MSWLITNICVSIFPPYVWTGGDLVAIESEIEDKFLDKEIRKLSNTFSYWIGGSDGGRLSLKKGDWFWVGSNQKINYRSVVI